MAMRYDAVVLAGGSGRRLGGVDKARVEVGGEALLARVLAAVASADRRICVGPARDAPPTVMWCREQPPGGGPVAALAAAMPHVRAEVVAVFAVDLPFLDADTVESLLAAAVDHDGAVAVDRLGRVQPLLAVYRRTALDLALAAVGVPIGARMRDTIAPLRLAEVPAGRATIDCDTPEDLAAARAATW